MATIWNFLKQYRIFFVVFIVVTIVTIVCAWLFYFQVNDHPAPRPSIDANGNPKGHAL